METDPLPKPALSESKSLLKVDGGGENVVAEDLEIKARISGVMARLRPYLSDEEKAEFLREREGFLKTLRLRHEDLKQVLRAPSMHFRELDDIRVVPEMMKDINRLLQEKIPPQDQEHVANIVKVILVFLEECLIRSMQSASTKTDSSVSIIRSELRSGQQSLSVLRTGRVESEIFMQLTNIMCTSNDVREVGALIREANLFNSF